MRRFSITIILLALTAGSVAAQEPTFRYVKAPYVGQERIETAETETTTAETPESPSYDSYESMVSGQSRVQQKAIFRAEQRQMRIESRKWYGYSQSRPVVTANPYMNSYYSPTWISRTWRPQYSWFGGTWY